MMFQFQLSFIVLICCYTFILLVNEENKCRLCLFLFCAVWICWFGIKKHNSVCDNCHSGILQRCVGDQWLTQLNIKTCIFICVVCMWLLWIVISTRGVQKNQFGFGFKNRTVQKYDICSDGFLTETVQSAIQIKSDTKNLTCIQCAINNVKKYDQNRV